MNVDSIRRYCLSFPQAKEKLQWGDALCFKIQGKLFAVLSLESVPPGITLKCSPEKFAELTELEGIVPAPYVGRYKWVLVEDVNLLPASELKGLDQGIVRVGGGEDGEEAAEVNHSAPSGPTAMPFGPATLASLKLVIVPSVVMRPIESLADS